MENLPNL